MRMQCCRRSPACLLQLTMAVQSMWMTLRMFQSHCLRLQIILSATVRRKIISNWQNCVIHQYHIMKSAHWLICLWNTLIKLSQHFTNNKFLCKIVTAFCKHMNLWLSWCGLDNIYTRTYPIYCIQYIKTPIQYSHVNCTMSLLHIYLLFRLYYKLHGSTHI